jgi:hypothetical protein
MNMIDMNGATSAPHAFECLRCGNKDFYSDGASGVLKPLSLSNEDKAKRFRDKSAEALALAEMAQTEVRRTTLLRIADQYLRTAEQFEPIATSNVQSKK